MRMEIGICVDILPVRRRRTGVAAGENPRSLAGAEIGDGLAAGDGDLAAIFVAGDGRISKEDAAVDRDSAKRIIDAVRPAADN